MDTPYEVWLQSSEYNPDITWSEFVLLFLKEVKAFMGWRPNYVEKLHKCVMRSEESVISYASRFQVIASHIEGMTAAE